MNILSDIQENTLIICNNNYKKYILKMMNKNHVFLNVKFYSKKEFFNEYLFKYNEKTLAYLIKKYNLKVDIAKIYLNNLIYIDEDKIYKSQKLQYLVNLKKELLLNNLLEYNLGFKEFLKNFNILVIGYPYLENYELNILKNLNAKVINGFSYNDVNTVYEFETMQEEINFVCKKIGKLLCDGVDINKIKVMGLNEEYYNDLKRIFSFYNIPINIPTNNSLYNNIIAKKFLDNFDYGLENAVESIKDLNNDIFNKIVNLCNK